MVTSAPRSARTSAPIASKQEPFTQAHACTPQRPLTQLTSASAPTAYPPVSASYGQVLSTIASDRSYGTIAPERLHLTLLKASLDVFFDSILVMHPDGRIIQTNGQANRLFGSLPRTLASNTSTRGISGFSETSAPHALQPLLDEIWRVIVAMLESQTTLPNHDVILDSDVAWDSEAFRVRVRWMDLVLENEPCLLITIEDLQQTVMNQVNVDRWKYKLTPREAEVWGLKRQGYSYKAIASTLFVSENTVKKHLKNIQAKRRDKDSFEG